MAAHLKNLRTGDTDKVRGLSRDVSHQMNEVELRHRLKIRNIERVTDGVRIFSRFEIRSDQILDVDELQQPPSIAGQNHGPVIADSIPEKCLAIVRILGPVYIRRAERDH